MTTAVQNQEASQSGDDVNPGVSGRIRCLEDLGEGPAVFSASVRCQLFLSRIIVHLLVMAWRHGEDFVLNYFEKTDAQEDLGRFIKKHDYWSVVDSELTADGRLFEERLFKLLTLRWVKANP